MIRINKPAQAAAWVLAELPIEESDRRALAQSLAATLCARSGGSDREIEAAGIGAALRDLGRMKPPPTLLKRLGRTIPGDLGAVLVNRGLMPIWAAYPLGIRKDLAERCADAAWRHVLREPDSDPEFDEAAKAAAEVMRPLSPAPSPGG
jgi:hypothetical protein